MTQTAYCSICHRTVYLEDEDTAVCPVCSTPLLTQLESSESGAPEGVVPGEP